MKPKAATMPNFTSNSPFNSKVLPSKGIFNMNIPMPDLTAFQATGRYFEKHKSYPYYTPGRADKFDKKAGSPARKFWDEERRRCKEGLRIGTTYVNPDLYAHLNYGYMQITEELTDEQKQIVQDGGVIGNADREYQLPLTWDSTWHMSNYIYQAKLDGNNAAITKARGMGASYYLASMIVNIYTHRPGGSVIILAPSEEELKRTDGLLMRTFALMDFIGKYTPFWKLREGAGSDKSFLRRAKQVKRGKDAHLGSSLESPYIEGITLNKPNKVRGIRVHLVVFDEVGNLSNADKAANILMRSIRQNAVVFGQLLFAGTGGSEINDMQAFTKLITLPELYHIAAMKNVFTKVDNGKLVPLFLGSYWNNQGFYDKLGRSNINAAFAHELQIREKMAKLAGKKSEAYSQYCAENALYIDEVMANVSSSRMPREELLARLDVLRSGVDIGEIGYVDTSNLETPTFYRDNSREVLKDFPITEDKSYEGAVVFIERYKEELHYFGSIDPYAQDSSSTNSHGSLYIMCEETDTIVAHYMGKPKTNREFAKICISVLRIYHAGALAENNVTVLSSYFYMFNAIDLLLPKPNIIKVLLPNSKAKQTIGMHMVPSVYNETLNYIRDWLISPSIPHQLENADSQLKNVDVLMDEGLIKELLNEKEKQNFDRLKSLSMLFLQRQELKTLKELGIGLEEEVTDEVIQDIINQIQEFHE